MALVIEYTCAECKQPKYGVVDRTRTCPDCRMALAEAAERFHMEKLAMLPLEERVRRIELELYQASIQTEPNNRYG